MRYQKSEISCGVLGAMVLFSSAALAQELKTGKLKISVSPKQAYTFVDGKAIGPGNRTMELEVGTHPFGCSELRLQIC